MGDAAQWRPIDTAPKDGRAILALNSDCEVFLARFQHGAWMFREQGARLSTTHEQSVLADGSVGWVLKQTAERWVSGWLVWSKYYEFKPTHWAPMPTMLDE